VIQVSERACRPGLFKDARSGGARSRWRRGRDPRGEESKGPERLGEYIQ